MPSLPPHLRTLLLAAAVPTVLAVGLGSALTPVGGSLGTADAPFAGLQTVSAPHSVARTATKLGNARTPRAEIGPRSARISRSGTRNPLTTEPGLARPTTRAKQPVLQVKKAGPPLRRIPQPRAERPVHLPDGHLQHPRQPAHPGQPALGPRHRPRRLHLVAGRRLRARPGRFPGGAGRPAQRAERQAARLHRLALDARSATTVSGSRSLSATRCSSSSTRTRSPRCSTTSTARSPSCCCATG